jgi:hypothetical protein
MRQSSDGLDWRWNLSCGLCTFTHVYSPIRRYLRWAAQKSSTVWEQVKGGLGSR